jgi:hypothetical protein
VQDVKKTLRVWEQETISHGNQRVTAEALLFLYYMDQKRRFSSKYYYCYSSVAREKKLGTEYDFERTV